MKTTSHSRVFTKPMIILSCLFWGPAIYYSAKWLSIIVEFGASTRLGIIWPGSAKCGRACCPCARRLAVTSIDRERTSALSSFLAVWTRILSATFRPERCVRPSLRSFLCDSEYSAREESILLTTRAPCALRSMRVELPHLECAMQLIPFDVYAEMISQFKIG